MKRWSDGVSGRKSLRRQSVGDPQLTDHELPIPSFRNPVSAIRNRNGSPTAPEQRMRGFLIFVLAAGVVFVYLRQKQNETPAASAKPVAIQAVGAKPTPAPLAPAPRGQASEHNWMKRSLDRARDVTEQARAQGQESQKP
jgi:hypothetical protein